MYKNEDPLDSLFRKTAGHLRVDFEDRDWEQMSRMLDEDDRKRIVRKRIFSAGIISAVVGLAFVFVGRISFQHEVGLDLKSSPLPKKDSVGDSPRPLRPTQKDESKIKIITKERTARRKHDSHHVKAVTTSQTLQNRGAFSALKKETENPFSDSVVRQISRFQNDIADRANSAHLIETLIEPKDSTRNKADVAIVEQEPEETDKKSQVEKLPWSAALVFAPDFSSVNMKEYTSPGQIAGLMAYCPLSSKLALGAGLLQSRKIYSANGSDYHVPNGYWDRYTNGVVPENINASCTIVEMSLQVRYQKPWHRSYVHAMAGVSSYYMYNESYQYSFATRTYGSSGFNSDESSLYLFKVASVSVGYERYLSPSLLIGIEPYLKLPMAEMGWSNVKLFSAGMFLTLRYSFKRNQHVQDIDKTEGKL